MRVTIQSAIYLMGVVEHGCVAVMSDEEQQQCNHEEADGM